MKYALFSCYYKDGIIEFARALEEMGYAIMSTGGTLKVLQEAGIKSVDVSEITGSPHMLGGRVKTLHPNIHGGILYRRENPADVKEILDQGISPIDIVVNNLYPFLETWKSGASHEEIIEKIDIGGPSMIRAAAKNFKYTTIITDNQDFPRVLEELKQHGKTSLDTRRDLARKAFNLTANYDAWIAKYFNDFDGVEFPEEWTIPLVRKEELRYGENPHQRAYRYEMYDGEKMGVGACEQLQGKALSFNNFNDAAATLAMIRLFKEECACVAVKHTNPCGIALGKTVLEAYQRAYAADDQSIFGGIVAFNREVDGDTARELVKIFLEVIIAPKFSEEALEVLKSKKNLRLLQNPHLMDEEQAMDLKVLPGTVLVQDGDGVEDEELKSMTQRPATEEEIRDVKFALKAVKCAKSNAVVLAKDGVTVGIGLGSVNRFFAVEAALKQAKDKAQGAVLASDGFFPFDDCVRLLANHGVKVVAQPGGSIQDEASIQAADELGLTMLFTGTRHFKH
ncbi:MAG: bifunctional phosphoribosylaminoimidazolecarboxamide formyltransferase/IMP cyclohydrolase [Tissierellia bacterium]|nr:bifunctional phosphoribosylaminoimidazolecarboxamide formyltransferase/IMP cyclohydrolase [Tissierellia bacterium]